MAVRISPTQLVADLSAVLDPVLARLVVEAYRDLQRRFLAGDWQPAELDAGRLCEVVSRCLLQLDQGRINHKDMPGDIRKVLLDDEQKYTHGLGSSDRRHIVKVIEVVYKFRSDRGAVHISPIYTANQMDSVLVMHAGKWIFAELLRLALQKDRQAVGEMIAQLVQIEHAIIHELDGKPMVLAKVTAPDEILLLLLNADGNRLGRKELRAYAAHKPQNVSVAISRLIKEKNIRVADNDEVALTPVGEKRVLEAIVPKYSSKP